MGRSVAFPPSKGQVCEGTMEGGGGMEAGGWGEAGGPAFKNKRAVGRGHAEHPEKTHGTHLEMCIACVCTSTFTLL